ncbi:MAG: hypothetical protein U0V56_10255 [Actinomycetota bacterium]
MLEDGSPPVCRRRSGDLERLVQILRDYPGYDPPTRNASAEVTRGTCWARPGEQQLLEGSLGATRRCSAGWRASRRAL